MINKVKTVAFDFGHPAHFHYFKSTILDLQSQGIDVFVTVRNKKVIVELAQSLSVKTFVRPQGLNSLLGKLFALLVIDIYMIFKYIRFRPDLAIGFGNPYVAHASWLIRCKSLIFDDTDSANLSHALYKNISSYIFTPACFSKNLGKNHRVFRGYMEHNYIHLEENKPQENSPRCFVRLVDWKAHHDVGLKHMSSADHYELLNFLQERYSVTLYSDVRYSEFVHLEYSGKPIDLHATLSDYDLFIGESATMAMEFHLSGVPCIFCDELSRSYTMDVQKKMQIGFYNIRENFLANIMKLLDVELSDLKVIKSSVQNYLLKNPDSQSVKEITKAVMADMNGEDLLLKNFSTPV